MRVTTFLVMTFLAVIAAASGGTSGSASAQPFPYQPREAPTPGRWSITPMVGTGYTVGGDFVKQASYSQTAAGTLFGAAINAAVSLKTDAQKFSDVYDLPINLGLGVNYALNPYGEVFGNLRWMYAKGKEFDAVNVNAAVTWGGATVAANGTLQGEFSDYSEYGLEVGGRQFFQVHQPFKSYVSGVVGVKRTNSVDVDLKYGGQTAISGIKFFDSGFAWSAGIGAGFRYDISPNIALGAEVGLRYESTLNDNDQEFGKSRYAVVNDGGNRWDIPVTAAVTIRF